MRKQFWVEFAARKLRKLCQTGREYHHCYHHQLIVIAICLLIEDYSPPSKQDKTPPCYENRKAWFNYPNNNVSAAHS